MPKGHRNKGTVNEKAKDFKGSIKRLITELNSFKILIVLALSLAMLSSVLALLAPNKLSDLTDKISAGLVVNKNNFEKLTTEITRNYSEEKIANILALDLSKENVFKINTSSVLSENEKELFNNVMSKLSDDPKENMKLIGSLPTDILNIILVKSDIKTQDKILFIRALTDNSKEVPESIINSLFEPLNFEGKIISSKEQWEFLSVMGSIDKDSDVNELYGKIDKMPEVIKDIIKPNMDMDAIKGIGLFLLGLYLLSAVFNYIESVSMTIVSNKFAKKLRMSISKKINILPLKYFDKHAIGDILSRVTNDVDTISQSLNQSLATLVSSITLFLGTIFMMFYTNSIMAITTILSSLIGFGGMSFILKKSQKYFATRQRELGNLNGHIEEIYSGLNVVKAYNGKFDADQKFDDLNELVCISNQKSQFLSGLMHPMMSFIGSFGYVSVCIVGALLTMNGYISFGIIVAFMSYVRLFTNPLAQIAQALTSLQSTVASSERVFEFLDEEELDSQDEVTKSLDKNKVKGNIEFKNVVFKYDGSDKPVINNFTASVASGQKIAIVGPTGAGKTTMVNLLMKFYELTDGDILIDGISIHDLTRENIHELFTMVLQDTWLFSGTVKENIVYDRSDISLEEVESVCKKIGLDHFIKTLPHNYESEITENDGISAGQKQLITIARSMIDDSPLLILDEATSNVDTRTEELVQNAMDKLSEGRTSFIIAHRLSTIKNADLILVMKDGNIIEQGNHEELMKQNGFYATLYNSQFEL